MWDSVVIHVLCVVQCAQKNKAVVDREVQLVGALCTHVAPQLAEEEQHPVSHAPSVAHMHPCVYTTNHTQFTPSCPSLLAPPICDGGVAIPQTAHGQLGG